VANITARRDGTELTRFDEELVRVRPAVVFRDARIDGFDALMTGVKAGETKTATATVHESVSNEELRGQQVEVEFEVLEVKREELPALTPTFVQQTIGLSDEQEFRSAARKYLERRVQYHQNQVVRQEITRQLTAGADWDLPPDLLKRQARRELERAVMELQSNGFSMEEINAHINQLLQNANASTAAALREHFILERIAEEEDIEADEADYELEILRLAQSRSESPRRVRARLEKRGQMDTLRNQIIERKVIELVMSHAQFTDVPFEAPAGQVAAVPRALTGKEEEANIPEAQGGEAEELRQPVDRP
jgi:trigger factor